MRTPQAGEPVTEAAWIHPRWLHTLARLKMATEALIVCTLAFGMAMLVASIHPGTDFPRTPLIIYGVMALAGIILAVWFCPDPNSSETDP